MHYCEDIKDVSNTEHEISTEKMPDRSDIHVYYIFLYVMVTAENNNKINTFANITYLHEANQPLKCPCGTAVPV